MQIQLDKKWKKITDRTQEKGRGYKKAALPAILVNQESDYTEWEYEEVIDVKPKEGQKKAGQDDQQNEMYMDILADKLHVEGAGACLYVNGHPVQVGAKLSMPIVAPVKLHMQMKVLGHTSITMDRLRLVFRQQDQELTSQLTDHADVLVLTPDYPSANNLYLCAFVHARVREYANAGLHVQVLSISSTWYRMLYEINGVQVFRGNYSDLKKILERKIAKVIVTHFVSEEYMQVFDGYIQDEKLIFICHGPETLFEVLPDKVRPYFTKPVSLDLTLFREKKRLVEKYARKKNVTWVFVSEWLKNYSEDTLGFQFLNTAIIHNVINEKLFPYREKKAEDRKKIIVIRKFDNIIQHSIDQSVLAIRELSRRPFFRDLQFAIYGDGNYFDELLRPVKGFSNVHIHRGFIPNEKIAGIYAEHGICLLPSRHDAHAVAMGEAAASGLVVVGSKVTSNPFFMNEEENHTLADPEDPIELADIVERLYKNPEEFLQISARMAKETVARCCKRNTVQKEIELIREKMDAADTFTCQKPCGQPVLTIAVPAYNVARYIEKCLFTLINHGQNDSLEILLINDGSKDQTSERARAFIRTYQAENIIVVDKENGGHGSAINKGLELANGTYFRLIDGDDWVDSDHLARQIELLKQTDVDLMLTKGSYEYVQRDRLENIINYDALSEGKVYRFEDLTYRNYGFSDYGPLLTTSTYRTDVLRKADFKISEKMPYVDMEFNSYSLKYIQTVVFYDLDIYRYLIGREGQTISRDFWKKRYHDHAEILFHICTYVAEEKGLSARKKKYIAERIIARMADSQIFMYDQTARWDELDDFLEKLRTYKKIYGICMRYVKEKQHDSWNILKYYKTAEKKNRRIPLEEREPVIGLDSSINERYTGRKGFTYKVKNAAKWIVPYEMAVRISRMK